MRESLAAFCHRMNREELLAEWDTEKNLPLTPETVSYGSKRRVWWRCANGHSWQAAVHTRSGSGTGCPYCSGRRAISGETDLATRYPDLAAEWHPTRNGDLSPADVLPGSHRLVWWQCEHGHEWRASVSARVNGSGCPVCASKKIIPGENDLASRFPAIAKEWHPTKNGALTPEQVAPASNKKVWWRCPKGHDYQAVVASRTQRNGGCPYCANTKVLPGFNDDTGPCSSGKPEKSMVAIQFRARMAGCDLFADRQSEQWLPVLHRLCFRKTVESIPEISARDVCA